MSKKQVNFKLKAETHQALKSKLEHGELSEELRQYSRQLAFGADVSEEERLLEERRELAKERREIDGDIETLKKKREEVERKLDRVDGRLEHLRERDGEYDGVIAMLEEDLRDGARVMPGTDKVKRAAKIGDCEPEDVIEDLKERNPNVPDKAFRRAKSGESPRWNDDTSTPLGQ